MQVQMIGRVLIAIGVGAVWGGTCAAQGWGLPALIAGGVLVHLAFPVVRS